MAVRDIENDWINYVQKTMVVQVISTGLPSGESEFNPGDKATYELTLVNGSASTGVPVKNVRLHVEVSDTTLISLVVPSKSIANAYSDAALTKPLTSVGAQVTEMFLQTSSMLNIDAGAPVGIVSLEVIALKKAGTAKVEAHPHVDPDLDALFPANQTGTNGKKSFTVQT